MKHAHLWFSRNARRTLSKVNAVPEGQQTTMDDLELVAELLSAALTP